MTQPLSAELDAVRATAAEVAERRYRPLAADWDANRTLFPASERAFLASLGFLGIVATPAQAAAIASKSAATRKTAAFSSATPKTAGDQCWPSTPSPGGTSPRRSRLSAHSA
jgi:alkylation response protein AidB-like acyl-CoA dehydrogenase